MPHFLESLAARLLEHHGPALHRVAVVLPGRRAGLHLRRYLAQKARSPLWSPEVLDPGAFLSRIAGWRQGSSTELLLMLHACHREQQGASADSLADFLQWAPTTLRDLSEVDAHLLNLESVYRDLRAYHELDHWSLRDAEALSPSQARALGLWSTTGDLHRRLVEQMRNTGVATSGAIAREAVILTSRPDWQLPWDTIWVAGLNALEPAATSVLRALRARGVLHVAWDTDHYYLDDQQHEAGRFLRRSMEAIGAGEERPLSAIREQERAIELINLPDRLAMARFAAGWASELDPAARQSAAIVLADEQLLSPLLECLPDGIGPVNVSMGVPINSLSIHGLVERFIRFKADDPKRWRTADLIGLLSHPMLSHGEVTRIAIEGLVARGWPVWDAEDATLILSEAGLPAEALLALNCTATDASQLVLHLVQWAVHAQAHDELAREQWYQLAILERELSSSLSRHGAASAGLAEQAEVRKRLLGQGRITFYGEPLRGLQVLGLLETRAIDFEHVLILGATEGILAGKDDAQSWIPFELRRHYKLPLAVDAEAIGSYHVHRLLHTSKRIALAHAPAPDGSGSPVRFIAQWEHELAPISNTVIHTTYVGLPAAMRTHRPIVAEKDAATIDRLQRLLKRGLSPSALSTWLRCPLDFHIRHLLGVRSLESIGEELGDDTLGIVAHRSMERIYTPWIGRMLNRETLLAGAERVESAVMQALAEEVPSKLISTGTYLLRGTMAGHALSAVLSAEAERSEVLELEPVALEQWLSADLRDGVRIHGKADRIERRNGTLCIVDLKTGRVDPKQLAMDSLSRDSLDADKGYALQLLMYAAMALHDDGTLDAVQAGIVPLRSATDSNGVWLTVGGERRITRAELPELDALLLSLIDEMLDSAIPFAHRAESKYCECCIS